MKCWWKGVAISGISTQPDLMRNRLLGFSPVLGTAAGLLIAPTSSQTKSQALLRGSQPAEWPEAHAMPIPGLTIVNHRLCFGGGNRLSSTMRRSHFTSTTRPELTSGPERTLVDISLDLASQPCPCWRSTPASSDSYLPRGNFPTTCAYGKIVYQQNRAASCGC